MASHIEESQLVIAIDINPPTRSFRVCCKFLYNPKDLKLFQLTFFGPLPESKDGKRWIFKIEDVATKWVELFSLPNSMARECAITLLDEVFLRYGIPSQFVSAVMQQLCFFQNIQQSHTPVYHPQANPVERKNRDLKPRLAILVRDQHDCWPRKVAFYSICSNT
ncbi:reverse transcriptase [Caerostris extrusa]|uniref:Reverse transcriptase n=1 Tax=Caerostris extrusa TaxID=172846 RepID=A0AAV4RU65_CAEEX|nr:reverse transcriptase [Caerostris extrusa]